MASPIGHSLGGLIFVLLAGGRHLAGRIVRRPLPWGAILGILVLANLPDLDFIPALILGGGTWHHRFTHSVFFAAAVSFCILAGSVVQPRWRTGAAGRALLGGGLILAHLGIDLLTADTNPPIGMRLFWPLGDVYLIAPWSLFDSVTRGAVTVELLRIWAGIALKEILLLGPALAAVIFWRRHEQ